MFHLSPNDLGSVNITKLLASYGATRPPAALKSTKQVRRIIRSLEEIEDEEGSGSKINSDTESGADDENGNFMFSGNYYERNSENMNFQMELTSGEEDWEGGLMGESGADQDDDVTDDILQTKTHGVTAVRRTEMASVVNPSEIEEFESDANDESSPDNLLQDSTGNEQEDEDIFVDSSSSGASGADILFSDEIDDQRSNGSGQINKTIMREVQRNLHKMWRYASSGKNLDMVSRGPRGKEEERKLQEIYNMVIRHESGSTPLLGQGITEPKESVSGDASGLSSGYADVSGESGNESDEKHEIGSAIFRKRVEKASMKSGDDDVSGESSGVADSSEISGESASGSGTAFNNKLMREVEHNLHKVWRYAAPKKDLDMVAKGPKGEEEEQKVKKIYNIISKHNTGSAFIDYEQQKKEKSLSDSEQTPKHHHRRHKSRKSRVKLTKTGYNATEEKLYKLQKAKKYKYNKNLKSLKAWGMGMGKSRRKPGGVYVKQIGRKAGKTEKNRDDTFAILGEEMKELAPSDGNVDKTKAKETSKDDKLSDAKSDKEETAAESLVNETARQEKESGQETNSAPDKSQNQKIVLDKQEPFDKTQLEIGRKLEEMILSRMAQLQTQRLETKHKDKQEHLKDRKEKDEKTEDEKTEAEKTEKGSQKGKYNVFS